tara:strand:+ start:400 stop:1119 length:720 start_codon:yes stop_codon:yes gene_type:complete
VNKNLTFIVPAAGKSSRFKNKKSKIFFSYKKKIILEHIIDKCLNFSENIIIISNKKNLKKIKLIVQKKYKKFNIKILVQVKPLGMGDAVNIGLQRVKTKFTAAIWADQIYIENETINKTIIYFEKSKSLFTFPVFFKRNPYTKVIRNKSKKFIDIIQSKEIDYDLKSGECDCGFFIFKTSKVRKLVKHLINKKMIFSKKSNEVEFLSAFKYIRKLGKITTVNAKSEKDTIGINFKKDLI